MADHKHHKREFDEPTKDKNGKWQHLVELILDMYDEYKGSKYRDAKIEEILTSRKRYEQEEEEEDTTGPWKGASKIVLPMVTISVDNLEPRLVSGLIGKKPYIKFSLESDQEPDDQTELLERWYNDELEDGVKIETETIGIMHDLLLEGTVYPVCNYEIEETIRRDFMFGEDGNIQMDNNGDPLTEDKTTTVSEGGKIEVVSFKDIFIADNVASWEKAPVIRKVYPTYEELMQDKENKVGYIPDNIGTWLIKEESDGKLSEDQQSPAQTIVDVEVAGRKTIECLECTVNYVYQKEEDEKEDVKDFTEEKYVVQIALEKQVIVRLVLLRELNFKNEHRIKRIRLFAEKGRSYGTSIYGKMRAIQDGASVTFNSVINIADMEMNKGFFYDNRAGLKGNIEIHPGVGVPVENVDGIKFMEFNINPREFIDFIYMWTQLWERLISIGDLQIGRQKEGKDTTATEVLAVIQEGNVKHNYQAKTFKEEFLSVLRTLYDLYYQHMRPDKTFLYNDEQVPIPRQAMRRAYKFRLTGSTEMSNKLIERKENEDLFKMLMGDPFTHPFKIREDLLKSYNRTNTDEYIIDPKINQLLQVFLKEPKLLSVAYKAVEDTIQTAKIIEGQNEKTGTS